MERFYWIELIGFDNESPDYGVGEFLSRCVSITGVSILFSHIDFIFDDNGDLLSPKACSYFGHEYNKERRRQTWTKAELRGLIAELHLRGVKVFFSSFDMTENIKDTSRLCFNSLGKPEKLLYVIKPTGNGMTVGDEVIDRLSKTLDLYGFDGLQLADGLSCARLSIENGDFSLPLCKGAPFAIPDRLMKEGEEVYKKRRSFILKSKRYEWTLYLAGLWAEFYEKLYSKIKKPIMFNNAWTRDSFEALYRYGIDYARIQPDKAYAVMIEENSATRAITNARDEGGVEFSLEHRKSFHYEYALMQQNIRLYTEGLRQISLTPITDTMEQWDALRHCPTELSRAIVRRFNNFVFRNGGFEVCCDAPHYCLSDGVPASDWKWLDLQESYRIPSPDFIDGFVAVFNKDCLYSTLKDYIETKEYYGASLLLELFKNSLNLGAMISLSEVAGFSFAKGLVVTDLKDYSKEDKEALCKCSLPLLIVGKEVKLSKKPTATFEGKYISVALYNFKDSPSLEFLSGLEKTIKAKKCSHGEIWTEPLSYARVDSGFFKELCRVMNEALRLDRSSEQDLKITSVRCGKEKYILLSNDSYTYSLPTVKTDRKIISAEAMMKDKGYKVKISEDAFCVRIPPRSAELVRLECE